MKIYTADKETGTFIDECKDIQEAKKLAVFSNQRKLYDFIWENFVLNEPTPLLEIQ